ncbi:sugar porter family MFS transporter [Chitinophaga sp. G-6-1-13]|uniref:Sugar porter family MFS transporter n=1 Tax=Chitinophaga fulva TaxID=2728842 RepID=A0A848GS98_9BACT|nr:hypothetical protein [Chitinophaga fulva]NML39603.1 sugar porter family MFS transporter [Chitinophaga fulva]
MALSDKIHLIGVSPASAVAALDKTGDSKFFIALVSFVAAFGGLLFGSDTVIVSGTIPYITAYFQLNEYALSQCKFHPYVGIA